MLWISSIEKTSKLQTLAHKEMQSSSYENPVTTIFKRLKKKSTHMQQRLDRNLRAIFELKRVRNKSTWD